MSDEEKRVFQNVVTTLNNVFVSYHAKLHDVLHAGTIQDFSEKMREKLLITQPVRDSNDFNQIMKEFKAGWKFLDINGVESKCSQFLGILKELTGPPADAATDLERQIKSEVEKEVPGLLFLPQPMYKKSVSTPENVVSIKPEVDRTRRAYSDITSVKDYRKSSDQQDEKLQGAVSGSSLGRRSIEPTSTSVDYPMGVEEKDSVNISGNLQLSELACASNGRSKPPTDQQHPIIPGKQPSGSLPSPVDPLQEDSGLSENKTHDTDAARTEHIGDESFHKPIPDLTDHSQHTREFTPAVPVCTKCMQPIHVDHNKNLLAYVFDRQEEGRQVAERRLCEKYQSDISELKKEKQQLHNECAELRDKLYDTKTELKLVNFKWKEEEEKIRTDRCELENQRRSFEEEKSRSQEELKQLECDLQKKLEVVEVARKELKKKEVIQEYSES